MLALALAACDSPPSPSAAPIAAAPGGSIAAVDPTREELRIALFWDAAAHQTVRRVGMRVVKSDEELNALLVAFREDAAMLHHGLFATIDAASEVPWRDVVAVVDACKRAGIGDVEFVFDHSAGTSEQEVAPIRIAAEELSWFESPRGSEMVLIRIGQDDSSKGTKWKVGTQSLASDREVVAALAQLRADCLEWKRPILPVVLDAEARVPWSDIGLAVDCCERAALRTPSDYRSPLTPPATPFREPRFSALPSAEWPSAANARPTTFQSALASIAPFASCMARKTCGAR